MHLFCIHLWLPSASVLLFCFLLHLSMDKFFKARRLEKRGEKGEPWTEVLSWEPRAFIYHNFLVWHTYQYHGYLKVSLPFYVFASMPRKEITTELKADALVFVMLCSARIIKSIPIGSKDSTRSISLERTGKNGEGLQVLHYEVGQKYEPHFDYFHDDFNTKNGGQRIATVLMYLSDVEEGGETVFPSAKVNSSSIPFHNELSECAKRGISVKPKMGDALLFWSMRPDGTLDPTSLHGHAPVTKYVDVTAHDEVSSFP
uniref:Prolyl 4-hydroxylase subunit alpha-1 n=1 Tax=Aegilops tauschii TaxID=37682 RepID=M8B771_AEGTA